MKKIISILLCLSYWAVDAQPTHTAKEVLRFNKGIPFIKNYLPENYAANPKINCIVQDQRGLMYFAGSSGVLEFDGINWRNIRLKNDLAAISLAIDQEGRIYVGANGDFGYLSADSLGNLQYVSLLAFVPQKQRNFESIHSILLSSSGIVFQSSSKIFIFKDNQIQVLKAENSYDLAFFVNKQLYVKEWGKGLLQFNGKQFELVPQGEKFAYDRIFAMLPYQGDKILIISRNQGLLIFDSKKKDSFREDFVSESVKNFVLTNLANCGAVLDNEHFIVGTVQEGILIINKSGEVIQQIGKPKGLKNNTINYIYTDNQNNTWLAMDEGITMLELKSPFMVFDEYAGLKGQVVNSIIHKNKLYVGTSQGIFYTDWNLKNEAINEMSYFYPVKDSKGFAGTPFQFQDELIYSHSIGVLTVRDSLAKPLISNEAALSFLKLSKKPTFLLVAKITGGLSVLEKRDDSWLFKYDIKGLKEHCNSMQEDKEGNIWISDYNKGIYKLQLTEKLDRAASLKFYGDKKGLPAFSRNSIAIVRNKILFLTRLGIYVYNPQKDIFEPNEEFNNILGSKTYAHPIVEDKKGNVWFLQFGTVGYSLSPQNPLKNVNKISFNKLKANVLSHITPVDENNILFGTKNGLFHYNPNNSKQYSNPFNAFIRKVSIEGIYNKDSIIFAGTFVNQNHNPTLVQDLNHLKKIPYQFNDIRFGFAAAWYEDTEQSKYQYFLEGYDKTWSDWSSKTEKSYTNLPEGDYTFYVKAKNVYDKESKIASYQFTILAPWYRSFWAYTLYFLSAFIFLLLIVRLNSLRLRQKNIYLAKEIEKGLAEIRKTNKELEKKNAAIEKTYQNVKLMGEIGKEVTANLSVEKIIDTVYENINMLMDASVFGIGIFNEQKESIDFIGAKEQGLTLPLISFSMSESTRLAVWCFQNQRDVFMNNYEEEYTKYVSEYMPSVTGQDASSIIYVPLLVKRKSIGVITVQSFQKNAYTQYHLNILQNLAIHAAIAIENAKAYQKLNELNMEKNHLISVVAHDLRNPLHHIYGLTSVIKLNSENLNERQHDYIEKILESTARINGMIDKILDMNAIESNKINTQMEETDLALILNEVEENFKEQAFKKNIEINFLKKSENCIAKVDKNYTFQVFENLLSNALKFSNPNESIYINLCRKNGKVRTEIKDQGPGINEEDMKKLFGKFQKLSAKPTAGENSVGLGLSIVKKYVEAMKGEVWCESEVGKGATFIVEFEAMTN